MGKVVSDLTDGYYFMFEIGWFLDLLIPTLVRVKDGSLYMVGSKACNITDLKPCCIPCGGSEECKKISFEDPSIKAFRCLESLTVIQNPEDLEGELQKSLANSEIRDRYFNTKGKVQKEATIERIVNDYKVLSAIKD
jgi:hypothetical protein